MLNLRRTASIAALILAAFSTPFLLQAAQAKPATAAATAATAQIDINTATLAQLKSFPGIGDAYAARIVAGRPYTAKTQLLSRGILPQATYTKIQAQIIAKQSK